MKMDRVIAGLVVLAIGMWAVASWWWFVVDIIKGSVAIGLILAGLVLVGLGLKNNLGVLLGTATPEETETEEE